MSSKAYPGITDEAYPDVFNINAMPPQPKELKQGQLPEDQIRQFFEKGYLIVPDFFKKEELEACKKDVEKLVDDIAQKLYAGGKIKNLYEDKGLFERMIYLEKEFPGTNILWHKQGYNAKSIQDLWSNERLLNLVEQLIGPEIMGHPVWNLRPKTPNNDASTVPWHQEVAYFDNDAYKTFWPVAWIPLLDASEQNGCIEVIPGGHLTGKVARHTCCWRDTWYVTIDEKDAEEKLGIDLEKDKVLCPVPYGGMLLFNNLIPHRSLDNISNEIRWAFDLRWQRPDESSCFFNLKKGVLMRSAKNPVTEIDWDSFNGVNRDTVQTEDCCKEENSEDPFDTTIVGPWMKQWEVTNPNRHTAKMTDETQGK